MEDAHCPGGTFCREVTTQKVHNQQRNLMYRWLTDIFLPFAQSWGRFFTVADLCKHHPCISSHYTPQDKLPRCGEDFQPIWWQPAGRHQDWLQGKKDKCGHHTPVEFHFKQEIVTLQLLGVSWDVHPLRLLMHGSQQKPLRHALVTRACAPGVTTSPGSDLLSHSLLFPGSWICPIIALVLLMGQDLV